ncbi:helix-turn-helix transcriptional regulator [Ruegeria sp.]|uniref:helix-turn-helix transcriptional regulator n=1 Tax=Ruegeria sp. TaxID=1879320 RepID=UPI00231B9111|nr:helix-turn-helix transcriptional regulator [Ruegeria sp.]MDA7964919.1 helix-turn-helix transcriptional regulator [Ruegeria sp.]
MKEQDPAQDQLAQVILAIESSEFAQHLRVWLGGLCRFDNITMLAFFENRKPEVFVTEAAEHRVFERISSHYVNGAYLLDPFYTLHKTGASDGLYRLADVAPDQFQRNEYFKSYYQRTTLVDELAFFSRPAPGVSITICIGRDASTASRFSARDLAAAHRIAPVVNALATRNWRDLKGAKDASTENAAETLRRRLTEEKSISLSARQSEIALLILQGHSSISIGLTLGISPQTVKVIRKQLYKKCSISSQGELYYLIAPFLAQNR